MTAPDKPLNVMVAEALGCKPTFEKGLHGEAWLCNCPDEAHAAEACHGGGAHRAEGILDYDTDWSATGPLIDRLAIGLFPGDGEELWVAFRWDPENIANFVDFKDNPLDAGLVIDGQAEQGGSVCGETPLGAVCCLIVALQVNGKLAKP